MLQRLEVSPDGESLQAVLWDGKLHTIPRMQAEEYMRAGCGSCEDYLGESADLAVGGVGAREKEATLIIRTVTGEVFLRNAIQMKLIATNENVDTSALRAAADEKSQRARAQAFKNLRLLSLDGLADPQKRSEAIHQFSLLYKMPTRSRPKETVRRSCTGC
jgi:coenzyme F420-reducing hydrogenase beta subunit